MLGPQVFRLLRSLRPLRVINRAPGLKLVVQTLLSSLRPIGNIVLICCTFFIIFGILGVQVSASSIVRAPWVVRSRGLHARRFYPRQNIKSANTFARK